jgi:hypothetical protein
MLCYLQQQQSGSTQFGVAAVEIEAFHGLLSSCQYEICFG